MLKNTEKSYGAISKFFHWLIFLIIIAMFGVGWYMTGLELSPRKIDIYFFHKSVGVTVLVLVLLRLFWRFTNKTPKLPEDMKFYEEWGAHFSHAALYALIIAIPLSGWIMSSAKNFPVNVFGLFTLPDIVKPDNDLGKAFVDYHKYLGWVLLAVVALHVSAALYHHFIRKDDILVRMLPWGRKNKEENKQNEKAVS